MTWLVKASWDSIEMVSHCLTAVPGWESVSLSHLFTRYPPNHGVVLTLIHCIMFTMVFRSHANLEWKVC